MNNIKNQNSGHFITSDPSNLNPRNNLYPGKIVRLPAPNLEIGEFWAPNWKAGVRTIISEYGLVVLEDARNNFYVVDLDRLVEK